MRSARWFECHILLAPDARNLVLEVLYNVEGRLAEEQLQMLLGLEDVSLTRILLAANSAVWRRLRAGLLVSRMMDFILKYLFLHFFLDYFNQRTLKQGLCRHVVFQDSPLLHREGLGLLGEALQNILAG